MSPKKFTRRSHSDCAPTRPDSEMRPVDGTLGGVLPIVVFPEDDAELRAAASYVQKAAPRNGWGEREVEEMLLVLGLPG